ncbi:MAG TPA: wax ester/triacylglycerol synthase family O-acyltransferase [Pseudonocardiaceae bacterium]|nr:wax ester/triacylglycerol synthase family O-acyltransferase [Pseudonocardiaceae bacterium]
MAAGWLSGLDTAFLCLDRDVTPMNLGGLAIFRSAQPPDPGRIACLLADRAQRQPLLRQRVQPARSVLVAATWAEDPGFRAADHIYLHHLDGPGSLDKVAALAAELMARALPRTRPLWEFHVISGVSGGRFAVLVTMHHAFADGLAALSLGLRVLDDFRPRNGGAATPPSSTRPLSTQPSMLSRLWHMPGDLRGAVEGTAEEMTKAAGIAASVLRRVRLPPPGSPLVISSSGRRVLATARLDLRQIRRIQARFGGTVNDVLLSVVAGALRGWLVGRGDLMEGSVLRAFVPVSRRSRSSDRIGGNQLSGYLCDLPVGEPDPGERLLRIRAAMQRSKAAGTDRGAGAIPLLADRLPPSVHRVTAPVAGQCLSLLFDLVVTSIPLPAMRFTLDGAELEEVYPLVPLVPGQALAVGLSWYRDSAYVGLLADREGFPDVARLADAFVPAAAALDVASG